LLDPKDAETIKRFND
jgi:hypothetical protein